MMCARKDCEDLANRNFGEAHPTSKVLILCSVLQLHCTSIVYNRSEREKYRRKSEKSYSKYLSLIIDGMDQDKTDIPHIISNPKSMAGGYTLEKHVTGLRAHGHCSMMVIDCGQFHHDTNLTIEILLQMFQLLDVHYTYVCHV